MPKETYQNDIMLLRRGSIERLIPICILATFGILLRVMIFFSQFTLEQYSLRSGQFLPHTSLVLPNKNESTTCLERRGQNGTWVPANGYNYDDGNGPFEPHTKWKWQDRAANCQIETLTPERFCKVMDDLQLKRIFFVGDSLTGQMGESLWSLLGNSDVPNHRGQRAYFNRVFRCSTIDIKEPFMVEISFTRRGELISDVAYAKSNKNKHNCTPSESVDSCDPWVERYRSDPNRTLLLANMGAHVGTQDLYERKLDQFVNTIKSLHRPDDITMFRTTVPGHENCKGKQPLADITEYPTPTLYNWKSFAKYNQYTREKWSNLTKGKEDFLILDVYPMTILRPDGHRTPNKDCLHYLLPGPVDWWNHLLFSNLLELSSVT